MLRLLQLLLRQEMRPSWPLAMTLFCHTPYFLGSRPLTQFMHIRTNGTTHCVQDIFRPSGPRLLCLQISKSSGRSISPRARSLWLVLLIWNMHAAMCRRFTAFVVFDLHFLLLFYLHSHERTCLKVIMHFCILLHSCLSAAHHCYTLWRKSEPEKHKFITKVCKQGNYSATTVKDGARTYK